jgi:hypothetical protein
MMKKSIADFITLSLLFVCFLCADAFALKNEPLLNAKDNVLNNILHTFDVTQDTSKKTLIQDVLVETFKPEIKDSTYKDAVFIGGEDSMYAFLERNSKYPAEFQGTGQQAYVEVEFVIEIDGSVSNVKAKECECAEAFKNAAIKLIQMTSKNGFHH